MAQYNKDTQDFIANNKTLFETVMIADRDGEVAHPTSPLAVSIHTPSYGGVDVTSKNRMKVSNYQTVFFNTFQFGKETDVWDEQATNGASAVHNSTTNNVDMEVTATAGSKIVRQSCNVMRYIPGRVSTLTTSIRLGEPVAGIRKRVGLFDENNGIFFELDGEVYSVVVRSSVTGSVVEDRVARDDWNGDKMDGTGPSGLLADVTKQQILSIEYEWYGAGQVKVGFTMNGITHFIHTFNHANVNALPWASTPFVPHRLELENLTGGQAGPTYLYQGSVSVISDGDSERIGVPMSSMTSLVGTGMPLVNTFYPVISIRLKSSALNGIAIPSSFQVSTTDNTTLFYNVVRNATITGGVWADHPDSNSFVQIHQYTGDAAVISGGTVVDAGAIPSGHGGQVVFDQTVAYQISRGNLGTTSDTYTIAVASSGANKDAIAAITWIEQR